MVWVPSWKRLIWREGLSTSPGPPCCPPLPISVMLWDLLRCENTALAWGGWGMSPARGTTCHKCDGMMVVEDRHIRWGM